MGEFSEPLFPNKQNKIYFIIYLIGIFISKYTKCLVCCLNPGAVILSYGYNMLMCKQKSDPPLQKLLCSSFQPYLAESTYICITDLLTHK